MKTDPLVARLVALLENAPRVPLLRVNLGRSVSVLVVLP
jgi:hypothetical protein